MNKFSVKENLNNELKMEKNQVIGRFAEPLRGVVGVPKELNLESLRDSLANHRFSGESSLSFRMELSQENETIPSIIPPKNKKKNNIKMAALYDNMISSSYTLNNGDLDKEKIANRAESFSRNK